MHVPLNHVVFLPLNGSKPSWIDQRLSVTCASEQSRKASELLSCHGCFPSKPIIFVCKNILKFVESKLHLKKRLYSHINTVLYDIFELISCDLIVHCYI
jgi:hypothetical protein